MTVGKENMIGKQRSLCLQKLLTKILINYSPKNGRLNLKAFIKNAIKFWNFLSSNLYDQ